VTDTSERARTAEAIHRDTQTLFREFKQTGGPQVREELVLLHQNLVRFLAKKFANRGEPLDDLIQVGMIGLLHAIDRFDPDRGIRFATYATPTIVGEIKRHFRDRGWAIKVPRRLQEINLAANKMADQLTQDLGRVPSVAEIAEAVGASEEEALEALELGQLYELVSLDSELGGEDDESHSVLSDYVGQTDEELVEYGQRARLDDAISHLLPREQAIVRLRFFAGLSQTDVARRLKISQMHVSRLQHRAVSKLREILHEKD